MAAARPGGMADDVAAARGEAMAGMAWGARRMQKVLDGDPTHAIGLEGRLASSIAWCASRGSTSMRLVNRKRRTLCGGLPGWYRGQAWIGAGFFIVLFGE